MMRRRRRHQGGGAGVVAVAYVTIAAVATVQRRGWIAVVVDAPPPPLRPLFLLPFRPHALATEFMPPLLPPRCRFRCYCDRDDSQGLQPSIDTL